MNKPTMSEISAQTSSSSIPEVGQFVLYEHQGQALLAVVLGKHDTKFEFINEAQEIAQLAANRLVFMPGHLDPQLLGSPDEITAKLKALKAAVEARLPDFDLKTIWEKVKNKIQEYSGDDLCKLCFSENSMENNLLIRLAIIKNRTYFKRSRLGYVPRAADEIEKLKADQAVQAEFSALREETISFALERRNNPKLPVPLNIENQFELLNKLAAGAGYLSNEELKQAKSLLNDLKLALKMDGNMTPDKLSYQILLALQIITPYTNLVLSRYQMPLSFGPKTLKEARALESAPFPFADQHTDLSDLECITIDDESTLDMDDALSLKKTATGYTVGVHISNVAAAIPLDSALDETARFRATSIYLPDQVIPMLPEVLSVSKLSLMQNQPRYCISLICELDLECKLISSSIKASKILVKERLSYKDVDHYLENGLDHPVLQDLYQIALALEMQRFDAGGFKIPKKEPLCSFSEDGKLELFQVDELSPGRMLVGEFAILANKLFAEYAIKHKLPFIYRHQEAANEKQMRDAEDVVVGLAQDYAFRSCLKPSSVSLYPAPHATLGLKAYAQCTSPIRRYSDLCNQRQIFHHLMTGNLYCSRERLEQLLRESDHGNQRAHLISKESRRFWMLTYIKEHYTGQLKATLLRRDKRTPLLQLEETCLPVLCRVDAKHSPGDLLTLKITTIDPAFDEFRLEEVTA